VPHPWVLKAGFSLPLSLFCFVSVPHAPSLPVGFFATENPDRHAFISQLVEAHFTLLGSTGNEAMLGSGELRRQFGLKLRAQDVCNLVYAMWRIEPESKLVVSVKSNPGQHTSAECANRGYRNIKPRHSTPVPVLRSETPTISAPKSMQTK
jgi:hypothetical protein